MYCNIVMFIERLDIKFKAGASFKNRSLKIPSSSWVKRKP